MRLHQDLSITRKSTWFMAQRLRAAWSSGTPIRVEGPVEVDQTCVGGRERNRRAGTKLKAGRGPVGRTAVAGVKGRTTNKIRTKTGAKTLQGFVKDRTVADAMAYTDEALTYRGIDREHETVHHGVGEYVRDEAHTNGMDSFRTTQERAHKGVFHKIRSKHLHHCINEFATRHNLRPDDTYVIMAETVTVTREAKDEKFT